VSGEASKVVDRGILWERWRRGGAVRAAEEEVGNRLEERAVLREGGCWRVAPRETCEAF